VLTARGCISAAGSRLCGMLCVRSFERAADVKCASAGLREGK